MFDLLIEIPALAAVCAGVLGLIVGSFLNVVSLRLPALMAYAWRAQCAEFNGSAPPAEPPPGLVWSRSRCPHCGHAISTLENVPLLSYLALRGRCSACSGHISLQYPLVEALTGLLSAWVVWHFGLGWAAVGGLLFTWTLIALSVIDLRTQLLPDQLTLPLLWLGLLLNVNATYTPLPSAVIGAAVGYGALWLVYQGFKLATGKEGMGYGDFKLFGAIGAWLGWQNLPAVILFASLVGLVVGVGMILAYGRDRQLPIPFGPYLAAAGFLGLLFGDTVTQAYLSISGLSP